MVVVGVHDHPVDLVGEGVDLAGAGQGQGLLRAAPDDVAVGREHGHGLAVPARRRRCRSGGPRTGRPGPAGPAHEHGHGVLGLDQALGDEPGVGDM